MTRSAQKMRRTQRNCVDMSALLQKRQAQPPSAPQSSGDALEEVLPMCSNCGCLPVATVVKCGFDDWCKRCDDSLFSTRSYSDVCDRQRMPPPPVNPVCYNDRVCPCGFFAIRNRPLRQPGKSLPQHLLVTVPITANTHIIICLICEQLFKHHRNGLMHLRRHHQHYHEHHVD